MNNIGIIGAGSWGTALAQSIAESGRQATLWAREPEIARAINEESENKVYLPAQFLSPNVRATTALEDLKGSDALLLVVPAQHVRDVLRTMRGIGLGEGKPIVICAKGIEIETGDLMSQVAFEEMPNAVVGILTGPTFAREVAAGLPCAVTVAAKDKDVAQQIRDAVASKNLRPYATDDLIGAQIGGAVKNVIAIACGIVMGLGLGENARCALMTRGLAEMGRLASAMGGRKETLMGMCGVGDLVLTSSSLQSRNYSLGVSIGEGRQLEDILGERKGKAVTEGVYTAEAMTTMARKHAVEMPISEAVYHCLSGKMNIEEAIQDMLERPLRSEE